MPIFCAKSRAVRGCASKPACGRRIDPHGAHSISRNVAANLPLSNGRTGSSAPTEPFSVLTMVCAILRLHSAGRGRTPPLRSRGKFYGFALARSNLQVRTAQSFRHGFAVPPPFTQGRLWCGANAATSQNVPPFPSSVRGAKSPSRVGGAFFIAPFAGLRP